MSKVIDTKMHIIKTYGAGGGGGLKNNKNLFSWFFNINLNSTYGGGAAAWPPTLSKTLCSTLTKKFCTPPPVGPAGAWCGTAYAEAIRARTKNIFILYLEHKHLVTTESES